MMFPNNWFDFAFDDIRAGKILLREEVFNVACFHFQQAAEKALKGFLVYNELSPTKEHNLIDLVRLYSKVNDDFKAMRLNAVTLNQCYMPTRYPDAPVGSLPSGIPSKAVVEEAFVCAKEIFDFCIDSISLIDKKRTERSDR